MKLWISLIIGTKPFFFFFFIKIKKHFVLGALGLGPAPQHIQRTTSFFSSSFLLKRTTPFKLDKNGKYIKTQLIIELLYNMLCKTKLYTLCVHLITAYVKEASTVYSSTQNPRKSLTCGFKVSNTSGTGELQHFFLSFLFINS